MKEQYSLRDNSPFKGYVLKSMDKRMITDKFSESDLIKHKSMQFSRKKYFLHEVQKRV